MERRNHNDSAAYERSGGRASVAAQPCSEKHVLFRRVSYTVDVFKLVITHHNRGVNRVSYDSDFVVLTNGMTDALIS